MREEEQFLEEVVMVSAVRTPVGRFGGTLKDINSGELASIVIKEALKRGGVSPEQVDEVILGEVCQTTESSNVARVAALRAGVPEQSPAFTVNRLCASGMQEVGGTENMSRAPFYLRNARFGNGNPTVVDSNTENGQQPQELYGSHLGMGVTAENIAERYRISREDQDQFAYESQRKAAEAINHNRFQDEIVPVEKQEEKKRQLYTNLPSEKVNVNGGAIALGHPLGATGCKIMTSLVHEMKKRQEKYGIATLCVGGGEGMAVLLERI
ncbi:hypothetical protein ACE1TI_11020 [Alteribacillus sp. JSM 102045]|uniref:thiolase family protein n=1 Tax=Alteribacillus sp. JSM 102045 TaxID=1562101 RepID=UPI0035C1B398